MINKIIVKILSLFICIWMFSAAPVVAQDPPPPPPSHGDSGNVPGGGAPIGGGSVILLVLGAAYGTKKFYEARTENLES